MGWRFHRIWSTDWFYRRGEVVQKLSAALGAATAAVVALRPASDAGSVSGSASEHPAPVPRPPTARRSRPIGLLKSRHPAASNRTR